MKRLAEKHVFTFLTYHNIEGLEIEVKPGTTNTLLIICLFSAWDEPKVVIALYQQSILVYMCRRYCQQTFSQENDHFFSGSGVCPWSID